MPLTLVVENGTGLANANSYATVAEADAYHEARLYSTDWETASEPEVALVWATRELDMRCQWLGSPSTATQALRWPRVGVKKQDADTFRTNADPFAWLPSTLYIDGDVIPAWLKNATAELARLLIVADRPAAAEEREVLSRTEGSNPISTSITFAAGGRAWKRVLPDSVRTMVAPYCRFGSGTIVRA